MSANNPDVNKLKKKKRIDELVQALDHEDPETCSRAALALGEVGDRTAAADVINAADRSARRARTAGAWDPGETARIILRSWATGAARSKDATIRDSAVKVLAAVESQEALRREVLFGEVGRLAELHEGISAKELLESLRQAESKTAAAEPLPEEAPSKQTPQLASADPLTEDNSARVGLVADDLASVPEDSPADVDTPEPPRMSLRGHGGEISMVGIMPEGSQIVSASWDGTLRIWEVETGENVQTLQGHGPGYVAVALAPEAPLAAAASADGTIRIWDLEKGVTLHDLGEHQHEACQIALTPDGTRVVSGSYDGEVRVWDVQTGRCLYVLEREKGGIEFLTILADGLRVVSGSSGGTLRMWDLVTGADLQEVGGHHRERVMAVVPGGGAAVTSDQRGVLRVWDLATGGIRHTRQDGEAEWVSAAAVSPDGRRALLGYWGGHVLLFDLVNGTGEEFDGHVDDVTVITVTPDGQRFVSGSKDGTVIVWDASTAEKVHVLRGHSGLVTALATTADGHTLISGSSDATLIIWHLP